MRLKAVFENTEGLLWPNQFVNARLLLDVKKDAVVIPSAAIQRGVQGTFVFVVGRTTRSQVRPVKMGVTEGNLIAVDSGSTRASKWSRTVRTSCRQEPRFSRTRSGAPASANGPEHHASAGRDVI